MSPTASPSIARLYLDTIAFYGRKAWAIGSDGVAVVRMASTSPPIMLVEVDEVDAMTVQRIMHTLDVRNPLVVAKQGDAAPSYLNAPDNFPPCIVLRDLNVTVMSLLNFWLRVKQIDRWRHIPVVVLTAAEQASDSDASFELGGRLFFPSAQTTAASWNHACLG